MDIVYVLINEALPGYVKIGRTSSDLDRRVKELSASTSVPLPFTCFYACTVKDAAHVERHLHDAFDNNRVNPRREFFVIDPERVVAALQLAEIEDITPHHDLVEDAADQAPLAKARRRRDFSFSQAQIPIGSTLHFSRDETITAEVIDDHHIRFNGKETSLSDSATKIMGYSYSVQGTIYWMFEDETLDERRRRLENNLQTIDNYV